MLAITVAFTLLVLWENRDFRPARTIDDPQFERAASAMCSKSIPPLRAVRRQHETDADLEQRTARQVDSAADRLEGVVTQLRTLKVRPANEPAISAWLGHFDEYITAGRHYADALRTGNDAVYNRVDDEGVAPLKAISTFARANHLDACIP